MVDRAADRRELRRLMRRRRASLPADLQSAAVAAVAERLAGLAVLDRASVVAGYRAVRGELDIDGVLGGLAQRGVIVTVPRVAGDRLEFLRWDPGAPTAPGMFGIPEPVAGEPVAPDRHDVVLAPLVAFDAAGNRLGQGGGYYDRTLAFDADDRSGDDRPGDDRTVVRRPVVIGIAHAFAQVTGLRAESWDRPLDAVVTDDEVIEFRPGATKAPTGSVTD